MKYNKIIRAICIICVCMLFISISIPTFADNFSVESYKSDSDKVPSTVSNLTDNVLQIAISTVRIVGAGISIIIITVIAIKYMMASAGERADIKKHAVPFVIGALVLFGSSQILTKLAEFATSNIKAG